jgi:hypothetical protein
MNLLFFVACLYARFVDHGPCLYIMCIYIYIYVLVTSHRKMLPFPLFYVSGNFLSNIWCVGLVIFCFNKGGFGFSTTSTWQ